MKTKRKKLYNLTLLPDNFVSNNKRSVEKTDVVMSDIKFSHSPAELLLLRMFLNNVKHNYTCLET